jgi:histidinol phosphatase-like enzyme (inositol monophosphatase family)
VTADPPLSEANLHELLGFAHRLADIAGAVIRPWFRAVDAIDDKRTRGFDPVTAADRDAEAAMRALIAERYPDHGVYGEEHGAAWGRRFTWVLDPIDGTRSFIAGFPTWGTLIALADHGRPVLGIMDQPVTGERFVGGPDGAFLGARRLRVRPCATLADAVLYSTTPDMFAAEADWRAFQRVERQVKLRRWGGDCYAYCMLAHGLLDVIVEAAMQPYDIQALIPVVEDAAGIVTNWEGEPAWQAGRVLAAGDRRVHQAALVALQG